MYTPLLQATFVPARRTRFARASGQGPKEPLWFQVVRDREPLAECALSLLGTPPGHFPDGVRDHKLPVRAQELGAFVMIAAERPIIEGATLEQIAPRIQSGVESVYASVTRPLRDFPAIHEPEARGAVLEASFQTS